MSLAPEQAASLVARAAAGEREAWEGLVTAYSGLVWAIVRNYRLDQRDAGDVTQTTWLRLLEHIDRLSDPARVGAWLATTARRECMRVQGLSRRVVLVGDQAELEPAPTASSGVDSGLLREERDELVRSALAQLPPRCQTLLRLMMLDPAPSYEEISAALDLPIGGIGPTRGRCLRKLRNLVEDLGIESDSLNSL